MDRTSGAARAAIVSLLAGVCWAPLVSAYGLAPYRLLDPQPSAEAAAVADLDGDGRDDLVLAIAMRSDVVNSGHVLVYLQRPDGSLAPPKRFDYQPTTHNTLALAVGDVSGDGRPDIVVGHDRGFTVFTNLGFGGIRRTPFSRRHLPLHWDSAAQMRLHDVDRDGVLDYVAGSGSGPVVYYNDGSGGIRQQVQLAWTSGIEDIEFGDVDGDGFDDLILPTWQEVRVHLHDGKAEFRHDYVVVATTAGWPYSVSVGDADGDGDDDLLIANDWGKAHGIFLHRQSGGVLGPAEHLIDERWPGLTLLRDLDGDGRDDLVVLYNIEGGLSLSLQRQDGFDPPTTLPTPYATRNASHAMAAGDLNGDGCTDIVVANYIEGATIFDGSGCVAAPDMSVRMSGETGTLALVVANQGDLAAPAATVVADITLRQGGLVVGALPAGCDLLSAVSRDASVSCTATVAAGGESTFLLPLSQSSSRPATALVRANVTPTEGERIVRDNTALHRIALPATGAVPSGKFSKEQPRAGGPRR